MTKAAREIRNISLEKGAVAIAHVEGDLSQVQVAYRFEVTYRLSPDY